MNSGELVWKRCFFFSEGTATHNLVRITPRGCEDEESKPRRIVSGVSLDKGFYSRHYLYAWTLSPRGIQAPDLNNTPFSYHNIQTHSIPSTGRGVVSL
ncbi:hypothetical protein O181_094514 [Austropuccinia psidii MF-1]|uniref:Uncharacterized protein n=1 Tax=Austropuccinia psidii MF-1 TaxID=1389203 RepID=A0A9Q3J3K0_9BASI|nr:hypothetical protein [Austropuccinia psidii MF-1]